MRFVKIVLFGVDSVLNLLNHQNDNMVENLKNSNKNNNQK